MIKKWFINIFVLSHNLWFFSYLMSLTICSEPTPVLSNSSQMDLYDQRASQTRHYPTSVSSSPQKDMQSKVWLPFVKLWAVYLGVTHMVKSILYAGV